MIYINGERRINAPLATINTPTTNIPEAGKSVTWVIDVSPAYIAPPMNNITRPDGESTAVFCGTTVV